jgi:hypothetical protein
LEVFEVFVDRTNRQQYYEPQRPRRPPRVCFLEVLEVFVVRFSPDVCRILSGSECGAGAYF